MPTLAELSSKVDELQQSLDQEQQQISDLLAQKDAAISGLNETIATLTAQLADGGTDADRQAVVNKLTAIKNDLEATVAP